MDIFWYCRLIIPSNDTVQRKTKHINDHQATPRSTFSSRNGITNEPSLNGGAASSIRIACDPMNRFGGRGGRSGDAGGGDETREINVEGSVVIEVDAAFEVVGWRKNVTERKKMTMPTAPIKLKNIGISALQRNGARD